MEIANLVNENGIILMGIYYDNKQDLINEINAWNKEIGNSFIPDGEFTDFEEIENNNTRCDILLKHTGHINPIARINFREMGWVWIEDYLHNKYYLR